MNGNQVQLITVSSVQCSPPPNNAAASYTTQHDGMNLPARWLHDSHTYNSITLLTDLYNRTDKSSRILNNLI